MWQTRYLGQSLESWVSAAVFAVVVFASLQLLRRIVARRLHHRDQQTPERRFRISGLIANLINEIRFVPMLVFSLYIASTVLEIPARIDLLLDKLIILMVLVQTAFWAGQLINFWLEHLEVNQPDEGGNRQAMVGILGYLIKMVVWVTLFLVALNNLGINVSALVAGFGIGGVAVAFAAQNILGDLFASLTIVLDKPFAVGDSIQVDNLSGKIEKIGLKTTRLRADSGEQLIFGNTDLLKSRIRNFKRMSERVVVTAFKLSYETSAELLRQVPQQIGDIVKHQPSTRLVRVTLTSISDGCARFEAVYTVLDPSYERFVHIQQEILLQVFEHFKELGIQQNDPQVIHVAKAGQE